MTPNEELKKLMAEVPLSQAMVADCLDSSVDTVKGWCANPDMPGKRYRAMHPNTLKLLKIELRGRNLLT